MEQSVKAEIVQVVAEALGRIQSPWFDAQEAAEYARCSRGTIDNAVAAGVLRKHRASGSDLSRYHRDDLDDWLRGKTKTRK